MIGLNIELFNKATRNLIKICEAYRSNEIGHTSNKFLYLPDWSLSQSNYFCNECFNPKDRYWKFERGSIVFVDFGINIGSEMSNRHFAIVLNNYDSPKNRTLTVIPLSSKAGKFNIKIPELIMDSAVKQLRKIISKQNTNLYRTQYQMLNKGANPDEIFGNDNELKTLFFSWLEKQTPTDLEKINKIDYTTIQKLIKLSEDAKKFDKLVTHYENFNKFTFAKCTNIQTVSKDRIIRLNSLDPVGKFKVSKETLDILDAELMQLFTKVDTHLR